MSSSAAKEWQTGAKWEEEEVPSPIKNHTRHFEEDNLFFTFFVYLNLTVSVYVSGAVWYFEALMYILCICVMYWAFRVFVTDRC